MQVLLLSPLEGALLAALEVNHVLMALQTVWPGLLASSVVTRS